MTTRAPLDLMRGDVLPRRPARYPWAKPAPLLRQVQAAIDAMLEPVRALRQQKRREPKT